MKIGIITFHASFNYGSMLQAYALHKVLSDMEHDVEIINFRSTQQREMYHHPINLNSPEWSKFHMLIHYIIHIKEYIPQIKKWNRYNSFLENYLVHTKEFHSLEELYSYNFQYDFLFIGSDQIWNTNCRDFSEAYWGNFCNDKTKKIAYAPSMGRNPESLDSNYIKEQIKNFQVISVREERTKKILIDNHISSEVFITLDPTLLLNVSDYDVFAGETPLIKGDYIYFYDPFIRPKYLQTALYLGEKIGLKIVVDRIYPKRFYEKNKNVLIYTKTGPKEFLNLIKYAKYIIGHSLHAVLFSILYKKDFYALDGDTDSRMHNILELLGLNNRAINIDNPHIHEALSINYWDSVYENYISLKKYSLGLIKESLLR